MELWKNILIVLFIILCKSYILHLRIFTYNKNQTCYASFSGI